MKEEEEKKNVSVVHILDYVYRSRDPDARDEAVSLCGQWDECSGSGRHFMRGKPTCPRCIAIEKRRLADEAEEDW